MTGIFQPPKLPVSAGSNFARAKLRHPRLQKSLTTSGELTIPPITGCASRFFVNPHKTRLMIPRVLIKPQGTLHPLVSSPISSDTRMTSSSTAKYEAEKAHHNIGRLACFSPRNI